MPRRTSSDSESSTTTSLEGTASTVAEGEPSVFSINGALGGTQAVQDFAIFTGMWEADSRRLSDFYDDVVSLALTETSEVTELSGGFALRRQKDWKQKP